MSSVSRCVRKRKYVFRCRICIKSVKSNVKPKRHVKPQSAVFPRREYEFLIRHKLQKIGCLNIRNRKSGCGLSEGAISVGYKSEKWLWLERGYDFCRFLGSNSIRGLCDRAADLCERGGGRKGERGSVGENKYPLCSGNNN